jgi:hypothetical protein
MGVLCTKTLKIAERCDGAIHFAIGDAARKLENGQSSVKNHLRVFTGKPSRKADSA